MKNYIIYLILCSFLFSCNKNNDNEYINNQEISHKNYTQNDSLSFLEISPKKIILGDVKKREHNNIKRIVKFTNKGKVPIEINKIDVSCGCIKTILSKDIILHNETVKMEVIINSKNNKGYFNKAIFINSTARNNIDLIRIQANFID